MRPRERRDSGQNDLFRARLDQIVDTDHPLAKLGWAIDWRFLEQRFGAVYSDKAGHPPLPTRLMSGLTILKHMHNLCDEDLCARWIENPYYQLFCGEEFFQHQLTFDRSSPRWRQRMGEERLVALIQETTGRHAHRRGQARRLFQGDRRHDRSTQGCRLSDRRQADASGARAAGQAGPEDRRRPAPVLRAGGETCADRPSALRPRQAVQARQSVAEDDPNLSRPHHARHRAQDQRRRRVGERLRPSVGARPPCASSASISAERRSAARARGRVHRQGKYPSAIRVRRQGLLPRRSIARRADSSSPTPRRCRATPTTATPLRP